MIVEWKPASARSHTVLQECTYVGRCGSVSAFVLLCFFVLPAGRRRVLLLFAVAACCFLRCRGEVFTVLLAGGVVATVVRLQHYAEAFVARRMG